MRKNTAPRFFWLCFLALSVLSVMFLLSLPFVMAQVDMTGQPTPTLDPIFTFPIAGEIGRALPRRVVYDPLGEQYAIVDAYNTLSLSDALTYRTRFTLEMQTEIVDLAFSHDGRWLAAINGVDVQLWNTQTGELAALLPSPSDPRQLRGPLTFSSRDEVLVFYGEYPAPPALRRTEDDRITYPWVWHLPAARGESASTLPDGAVAHILYDYPNGFTLTPDDRIIAALPSRLRVLNALTLATEYEIATDRYEQDPLTIWMSLRDNRVYVFSARSSALLQVNAAEGALTEISLRSNVSPNTIDDLELGSIAQTIGGGELRYLLLDRSQYRTLSAAQITLVDLLTPPGNVQGYGSMVPLLYYESIGSRQFIMANSNPVSQYALSPDGATMVLRQQENDEYVVRYDIASGEETERILPSLRSIGGYSRSSQNRVLSFDAAGDSVLSDFQRLDATTLDVLSDDLRYSFQFERFFFGREPGTMVTISGTEWRVWNIADNTVLRREIIQEADYIRAISSDGYRILTNTGDALGIQDFGTNEFYHLSTPELPEGSSLSLNAMLPNPSWTRLLAVYSDHPSGPYTPGGALASVNKANEVSWLIAGDDLPAPLDTYGWVDDETVYAGGAIGVEQLSQERIFGVEYATNGLPQCLMDAFSESSAEFLVRWQRLLLQVRPDRLSAFVLRFCDALPASAADAAATLVPTNTPERAPTATLVVQLTPTTPPTPLPVAGIPDCLIRRFPSEADDYAAVWRELSAGLASEQVQELSVLLCEGIGVVPTLAPAATASSSETGPSGRIMFIDAETGERGVGAYTEPFPALDPLISVRPIYGQYFQRTLGTALLNTSKDLLAVSNLPGELTIYRLGFPYERAGVPLTATAEIIRTQQNLIYPNLSDRPTQTPQSIGTALPTLTVTPAQTILPRPQQDLLPTATPDGSFAQSRICSAETLYSIAQPPMNYSPSGRIYALFSDGPIWSVEPENGARAEAPEAPQCERGLNCQFSPDRAWILAQTYELVYVVRPDNSDQRVLWDLRTPDPPTPFPRNLHWSGPDTLEWEGPFPIGATPESIRGTIRDTPNVYPDPAPFLPAVRVDEIPTEYISRQPGGDWAVVRIQYGTGTSYGYRYYLVNTAASPLVYHEADRFTSGYGYYDANTLTGDALLFAQDAERDISIQWSPFGDRLYFTFVDERNVKDPYEVVFPEGVAQAARNDDRNGEYSPDGRYIASFLSRFGRAPSLQVHDVVTGRTRNYCLPQARNDQSSPEGMIVRWSPDARYLAVQVVLEQDDEEHLLIVIRETGEVVDLSAGVYQLITWAEDPGGYGEGSVSTPLPSATPTLQANGG